VTKFSPDTLTLSYAGLPEAQKVFESVATPYLAWLALFGLTTTFDTRLGSSRELLTLLRPAPPVEDIRLVSSPLRLEPKDN
jgi:hypothetical protein